MSGTTIAIVVVVAVVVVLAVILAARIATTRRRRHRLQEQFGPEYDRAVDGTTRKDAERDLEGRVDLRNRANVRPLPPAALERYTEQWRSAQARFVDEPALVVSEVDALVANVMRERGYPVDEWDQRAAVVSVDHPQLADDYRAAHDVCGRGRGGNASTDELRDAFLRYRRLFDALIEVDREGATSPGRR